MTDVVWLYRTGVLLLLLAMSGGSLRAQTAMTMDDCVTYALGHSPEISQRLLQVANQELGTLIARQKFAPGLAAKAGYASKRDEADGNVAYQQDLPAAFSLSATAGTDDVSVDEESRQSYALRLSKLILGGGSYRASMLEIDNSLIDEVIAANLLELFRRDIVTQVRQLYYRLIREQQTLHVRKLRLERSQRNLAHAREREDPLDIATAEVDVPVNEANVLRSEREIQTSKDRLKEVIGMPLDDTITVTSDFIFEPVGVNMTNDLAYALTDHEELVNQRLRIQQIANALHAQKEEILPDLVLGGGVTSDRGNEVEDEDLEYRADISLSWEWMSRADRARVARQRNVREEAKLELKILERSRQREITDLARRMSEALKQVELSTSRLTVARRRMALYQDRWENGEIDILEYVRSQNDLEETRVAQINEQTAYLELLAQYRQAVGRE